MLAYHYLTTVLETLSDIKDLIDALTPRGELTQKPIEEMLEILEDPPTTREIPHDGVAKQCDPFCTNATESVCISGYQTLGKPRFSLKRWREKSSYSEDNGQWWYSPWMINSQAFILKEGGQGNNDIKNQWKTNAKDQELKFVFEAKQYGFIALEGDGINNQVNKDKTVEIRINEVDMKTGKIVKMSSTSFKEVGKALKCIETDKKKNDDWLLRENGCNIGGLQPYQKYELVINVVKQKVN